MKQPRIGVIIPAFNEAPLIAKVVTSIPASIKIKKSVYKLVPIVVDDGSFDKTAARASVNKRVVVISHIVNSGVGAATRTGLRYLRENNFSFGATLDADGQHHTKDLIKVLTAVVSGQFDLIIGSRLLEERPAGMSWPKMIGNKGLNLSSHLLLGVRSTDSQSGLKAFNKTVIEKLNYRENGYGFCSEFLWRAHKLNLRITEVPIETIYTDYSKGKGQSNWSGFQIIKQLIKHRLSDLVNE